MRLGFGVRILLALSVGCGASAPAARVQPRPLSEQPADRLGSLPMLVPEGASVVLVLRPTRLMASPSTARLVDSLFPPDWVAAFERRTGVRVTDLTELVVAQGSDTGWLALARGPWSASDVARANAAALSSVSTEADEPFVWRGGLVGAERRDLVALADRVLLVGVGASSLLPLLIARVRAGEWTGSAAPALASRDGRTLHTRLGGAPAVLFQLAPLERSPVETAAALLLGGARMVAGSLGPAPDDRIEIAVALRGAFPDGALGNFRAMALSVATDALGGAVGLGQALDTLRVEQVDDGETIHLRAQPRAESVVRGAQLLFVGSIRSIREQAVD